MIRTGEEYRESLRDGRAVFMDGERVADVTTHPMFRPLVDIRARIYDMAHEPEHAEVMTVHQDGEVNA
ncbi:MAG: 4-hydroxyphenylacetate 3-hydroxylase N-terminal domain-containing protein, partial [Pseudomonadota bacterium]